MLHTRHHAPNSQTNIQIVRNFTPLTNTPLIVLAVPSPTVRSITRELENHLSEHHMMMHGIHNLSKNDLRTISQILRKKTPVRRLKTLENPVQTRELHSKHTSTMMIDSTFPDITTTMIATLEEP